LNLIDSQPCPVSFVFRLSSFLLDDNNLNGMLPSEFGNLSNLKKLYLSKCLELVFHKSLMEFVWVFVVLLEEGLNRF